MTRRAWQSRYSSSHHGSQEAERRGNRKGPGRDTAKNPPPWPTSSTSPCLLPFTISQSYCETIKTKSNHVWRHPCRQTEVRFTALFLRQSTWLPRWSIHHTLGRKFPSRDGPSGMWFCEGSKWQKWFSLRQGRQRGQKVAITCKWQSSSGKKYPLGRLDAVRFKGEKTGLGLMMEYLLKLWVALAPGMISRVWGPCLVIWVRLPM
jgi:hypothetical protein